MYIYSVDQKPTSNLRKKNWKWKVGKKLLENPPKPIGAIHIVWVVYPFTGEKLNYQESGENSVFLFLSINFYLSLLGYG